MAKRKKKSTLDIVAYAIFALLVLSVVGFAAYFTNGFSTGFQTYYVNYKGKKLAPDSAITLPYGEELRFDCKSLTDIFKSDTDEFDYLVDIGINQDNSNPLMYYVDNETAWLETDHDLSSLFNLVKYDTYFTIKIDKNMHEVLEFIHPDANIQTVAMDYSVDYFFEITVRFGDDIAVVSIDFRSDFNLKVRGVELDRKEIVF